MGKKNNRARNYQLPKNVPTNNAASTAINPYTLPFTKRDAKLPQYYIMPQQLDRIVQDISLWRNAVKSAENALYPTRYEMQRMFVDTILEGETLSCMNKRKDLTLLKNFVIQDSKGKVNDDLTKIFRNKQWFNNMLSWMLDAQFYGYSLIQLGDLANPSKGIYKFPQMTNIRRWNVEPDRQNLVSIPLQKTGINFMDPSVKDENGQSYYDWTIYVDTPTDIGHSICGYGLLYSAAIYAIILKGNLSDNANFNEKFGTPYRHAKTAMTLSDEVRDALEDSLASMGANGYVITPDGVTIDFHQTNTGTGFQTFDNLEQRCQKMISKLILGHANAMEEVSGKLGGGQGAKDDLEDLSPAGKALVATEKKQDTFILNVLNDTVLPKLRNLGFPVPEEMEFAIANDKELFETRKKEDAANKVTAEIAQTMKNAGFKMDARYFEERTGIPTEEAPEPEPQFPAFRGNPAFKNKLKNIYRNV